jgi:signal transduction histidine kinase
LFRLLPRKTSLRMRVVVCCAMLGAILGTCMAFVAEQISEHSEHLLIDEEMTAEMDIQIAQHGADPDARLPRSPWKSLYIDRPGKPPTSPTEFRSLAPGVHELEDVEDGDRFAAIRIAPIGRVTMVAGLPSSPARERRLVEELVAMILLGTILGGWLGRMLAGSMLAPVLRLSHEVDSAEPGAELQRIASDHPADEVGALALALMRYRDRMRLAIEREVLFSADASHELRTPLCVLQGALDLLRENQGPTAPGQRRLERVRRSAAEIGTLLDALLLIARSGELQEAPHAAVEFGPTMASVIAEFREELDAARITIKLRCAPSASVHAPPNLLRIVLRLLFRSIASGAFGTRLRLDADVLGLVLASAKPDSADATGNAASGADSIGADVIAPVQARTTSEQVTRNDAQAGNIHWTDVQRSDEQGGIGMLRRLCQRYGWTLELVNASDQPTLLILRIPPHAATH